MFQNLIYEIDDKNHRLNVTIRDDEGMVRNLHIVNSDGRILDVYPKILTFIPDVLKYYLNKNKIIQMQT